MIFVKLTNADGEAVYINPALVTAVCKTEDDKTTGVEVCGMTHWEVKETPEEVVTVLEKILYSLL